MALPAKPLQGLMLHVAAVAFAVAVLRWFTPPEPGLRICGFHWLTGRPCPLCGLTHAMFALAKGHWGAAIHFHALSPLGCVMLFGLPWNSPVRARLWTAGIAAFAIYGVCRIFLPVS